jgi:hypothetical protein
MGLPEGATGSAHQSLKKLRKLVSQAGVGCPGLMGGEERRQQLSTEINTTTVAPVTRVQWDYIIIARDTRKPTHHSACAHKVAGIIEYKSRARVKSIVEVAKRGPLDKDAGPTDTELPAF